MKNRPPLILCARDNRIRPHAVFTQPVNYDFQAFLSKNRVHGVENRLPGIAPDRPESRPEVCKLSKSIWLSLRRQPPAQSYTKVCKVKIFLTILACEGHEEFNAKARGRKDAKRISSRNIRTAERSALAK
jgi:hypothetical protein